MWLVAIATDNANLENCIIHSKNSAKGSSRCQIVIARVEETGINPGVREKEKRSGLPGMISKREMPLHFTFGECLQKRLQSPKGEVGAWHSFAWVEKVTPYTETTSLRKLPSEGGVWVCTPLTFQSSGAQHVFPFHPSLPSVLMLTYPCPAWGLVCLSCQSVTAFIA